jgi:hypothetical protein
MTKITESIKDRMIEELEQLISDIHDVEDGWDVELPGEIIAALNDAKAALGKAEDLIEKMPE